jgi:hypothetical protein
VEAGERVRYAQACPGCGEVEKKFFRHRGKMSLGYVREKRNCGVNQGLDGFF